MCCRPDESCLLVQNAVVRRVDNALGLLLELPAPAATSEEAAAAAAAASGPAPAAAAPAGGKQKGNKGMKSSKAAGGANAAAGGAAVAAAAPAGGGTSAAGYAHISAVADERVEKLDKVTRLRVFGDRLLWTLPEDCICNKAP